jgi:hypothetical protein
VLTEALTADREVTLWWGTPVECLSAIYRRHREAAVSDPLHRPGLDPVDEQVFAALRGYYAYDASPRQSKVESTSDTDSVYFVRERVRFNAAVGRRTASTSPRG